MKKSIHIKELEKYTKNDFAAWLYYGFQDLNSEDEEQRLGAFSPLYYYIRFYDTPSDGLKSIYDELSGKAKQNFCSGIQIAFSRIPHEYKYVSVIRSLLYLASEVHATEILPEIVKCIGNGYFGMPENEELKNLFVLSLKVVSGMAPYLGTAKTIRQLVSSRFFRPVYSGFAPMLFIALCRTEPEKFPSHLELLRHDFSILHKKTGTNKSFITAMRFVQYVDLHTISKNLCCLYVITDPTSEEDTDNWFIDALFVGKEAPLILYKDTDFYLARKEDKQNKYKIQIPPEVNEIKRYLDHIYERETILIPDLPRKPQTSIEKWHLHIYETAYYSDDLSKMPPSVFESCVDDNRLAWVQ
ncbi:MAG TPA: hypothetical protein ENK99_06930 [Campylobacterales bacterium]|nr:hypothetical protein [Campylobacterales bacterium]